MYLPHVRDDMEVVGSSSALLCAHRSLSPWLLSLMVLSVEAAVPEVVICTDIQKYKYNYHQCTLKRIKTKTSPGYFYGAEPGNYSQQLMFI